jgi:hypothetical protein
MAKGADRGSAFDALRERLPGETILDDLTEQLDRTRRLLTSSPEAAAEAALARFGGEAEIEARIAADLAAPVVLANPEGFLQSHRLAMRALEVLDREGSRDPLVSRRFGPLKPLAQRGVEFVAEYIVKSYAARTVDSMRRLYTRREPQAERGTPERILLAQARVELDRLAPGFTGGGIGAPALVAGGAVVPLLASVSQYLGAIDFLARPVLVGLFIALIAIFAILSSVLLSGAAVAHRRSNLIMRQPLAALWETVGHCGDPPQDSSRMFASAAVLLSALVWVVIPVAGVLTYVLT